MHDESPSGGQNTDFILIDVDSSSPSLKLKEIMQEKKSEIDTLNEKLQRAQWVINYLEKRNEQLEDQHTFMELQRIREDRELARKRPGDMTPFERETCLMRVNIHLEKLLVKANREKYMLIHMKNHYWAHTHVFRARMKILKARLRKSLKRQKRPDPLQILVEASLAENET